MRLCIVAIVFLCGTSFASIVVMDDMATMTRKSDVVVQGLVADISTGIDEEGRPITYVTLEILDHLKGKTGQTVKLYQVGGKANGREYRVLGASRYKPGEEVILFGLQMEDAVVSYSVGVGKFRVLREGKVARVVEDLQDVLQAKRGKGGNLIFKEPQPREYISLDNLKKQIREWAKEKDLAEERLIKEPSLKQPNLHEKSQEILPEGFISPLKEKTSSSLIIKSSTKKYV